MTWGAKVIVLDVKTAQKVPPSVAGRAVDHAFGECHDVGTVGVLTLAGQQSNDQKPVFVAVMDDETASVWFRFFRQIKSALHVAFRARGDPTRGPCCFCWLG